MNLIPPQEVAQAAAEGLQLRRKWRRGGTVVGQSVAAFLVRREPVPASLILRMYSYFARHEVDKKGKYFFDPSRPSNGYIAWQLWGGDAGRAWATECREGMRSEKKKP